MAIVLVHGAWGGAWCWKEAARLLRARGIEVYAPTLSGVGDRSHIPPAAVSLETQILDVANLMRWEELERVLLVGHSYGGMVITGAADREPARVGGMVYLDAFVPESGRALWDYLPPAALAAQRALAEAHGGALPLPPGIVDPAPADRARLEGLLTLHPVRCFSDPFVSVRAEQSWPKRHYILCTEKANTFPQFAAKVRGRPGWDYSEFAAAHDVVWTHPQDVADRLYEIGRGWGLL